MKPIKNMLLFLLLTAVNNYGLCLLSEDVGGIFVMLLVAVPLMTLCYAILYATINGFSFLYPLIASAISFAAPFTVLHMSLKISGIVTAALFILALFGCAVGQIFYTVTNAVYRIPNKKRRKR